MIPIEQKIKAVEKFKQNMENIGSGHGADFGYMNCECCKTAANNCDHCLIHEYSGNSCECTPYADWRDHHLIAHSDLHPASYDNYIDIVKCYHPLCPECKEIAQREADYLGRVLKYAKGKYSNKCLKIHHAPAAGPHRKLNLSMP